MVNSIVDMARTMSATVSTATDDSPNCVGAWGNWGDADNDRLEPVDEDSSSNSSTVVDAPSIDKNSAAAVTATTATDPIARCLDPAFNAVCDDVYRMSDYSGSDNDLAEKEYEVEEYGDGEEVSLYDHVSLVEGEGEDNEQVSDVSSSKRGIRKMMSRRLKKMNPKQQLKSLVSARTFTFDSTDGDSKPKLKNFLSSRTFTFDKDDNQKELVLDSSIDNRGKLESTKEEAEGDDEEGGSATAGDPNVAIGYVKEEFEVDVAEDNIRAQSEAGVGGKRGSVNQMKRIMSLPAVKSGVKLNTTKLRSFKFSRSSSILDEDANKLVDDDEPNKTDERDDAKDVSLLDTISQNSKDETDEDNDIEADEAVEEEGSELEQEGVEEPAKIPVEKHEPNMEEQYAVHEFEGSVGCSFEVTDKSDMVLAAASMNEINGDIESKRSEIQGNRAARNDMEEEVESSSLQETLQSKDVIREDDEMQDKEIKAPKHDSLSDDLIEAADEVTSHTSKGSESKGANSSVLDISLFKGRSIKGSKGSVKSNNSVVSRKSSNSESAKSKKSAQDASVAIEQSAIEEGIALPEEKPYEFRQTKVTLKFKAIAGITQMSSQKNTNNSDAVVKAVATYRRNTIASDRFVSTHVPSLPVFLERTPDVSTSQVYAQWPAGQRDDDTASSSALMSSVSLVRTVRRVRNLDNLSCGTTVGGSQVKEPKEQDSKKFLASLTKAFAPELLDLQVGLLRGSSEIIPLGVATVVIPGEYKRMELDIPIVRNYTGASAVSKKKITSSLRGKAGSHEDYVYFSADKNTQYKINEGAFLRLELKIEPAPAAPTPALPPRHLNTNTRKADFRSGPINQAIRHRQKLERLMSQQKLPLHHRVSLYLEQRNRSRSSGNVNKAAQKSKEICITRQSEISEVSCEVPPYIPLDENDESASLRIEQFDLRSWATASSGSCQDKDSNSFAITPLPPEALAGNDDSEEDERSRVEGPTSVSRTIHSEGVVPSIVTADDTMNDSIFASLNSDASANVSINSKEEQAVTVDSLIEQKQDGRMTSDLQDLDHGDGMTQFSSSLHSIFTTNHPQKRTAAQSMLDLLLCDTDSMYLCDEERNALKYYAHEQDESVAYYCAPYKKCAYEQEETLAHLCAPYLEDDNTYADEDTLASLESLSVIGEQEKVE